MEKEPDFLTLFIPIFIAVALIMAAIVVTPFLKGMDFDFFESNRDFLSYLSGVCEDDDGRMIDGDCYLGSKCDKFVTTAICRVKGNIFQISSYYNGTVIDVMPSDRIKKHCSILTKINEQSNCSMIGG